MVVLIDADAISHVQWPVLRKNRRTGLAFLIGIVPVALIALKGQVSGLHFRLLQAEEVGIQLFENLTEALALASTQAIYVPTYKFHIFCSFDIQGTKITFFFVSAKNEGEKFGFSPTYSYLCNQNN